MKKPKIKYLRCHDVIERTGLSRSSLWRLEAAGRFPRRRKLSDLAVGWLESEIDEWLESRKIVGEK